MEWSVLLGIPRHFRWEQFCWIPSIPVNFRFAPICDSIWIPNPPLQEPSLLPQISRNSDDYDEDHLHELYGKFQFEATWLPIVQDDVTEDIRKFSQLAWTLQKPKVQQRLF